MNKKNRRRKRWMLPLFIATIIFMSTVSVSGLFKFSGDKPSQDEIKEYIISNIDNNYTGYDPDKELEEVATLTVKNTYINMEVIEESDESLAMYFDKVHNEESLDGYVITTVSEVPLFHLDDESEYVVGIINTDEQSEVFDVIFAENNDKGEVLKSEYYDSETGLAYISIFDLYREENEALYTDCVQAQLLRPYDFGNESEVKVKITDGDEAEEIVISEDVVSPQISIPIDETKEIENIYVNGNIIPIKEDDYRIEEDNLIINTSPANLSCVDIVACEPKKSLASAFFEPQTAYALSTDSEAITDIFGVYKKEARVGDYVDFKATGTNAWSACGINYVQTVAGSATSHTSLHNYMVNHYGTSAGDYVTGWYNGGKYKNIYRSTYNACYGIKMDTMSVKNYNSEYLKEWLSNISEEIQMGCIEVSTASFQDMAKNDNLDYTAMITAVGDGYVAISFCSTQKTSKGTSNQVMCGTYAVKYEPEPDTVKISYKLQSGYWPTRNHISLETVKVEEDKAIQYLSIEDEPKREGYAFMGWTLDETGTVYKADYDIGDMIKPAGATEDITLYAVWKEAKDMEYVYTDYGNVGVYLSEDPENFEETTIKVPSHHYFKFEGYFTEDGTRITDERGHIIPGNYKNIYEGGTFTNIEDIKLYAYFSSP